MRPPERHQRLEFQRDNDIGRIAPPQHEAEAKFEMSEDRTEITVTAANGEVMKVHRTLVRTESGKLANFFITTDKTVGALGYIEANGIINSWALDNHPDPSGAGVDNE